MKHTRKICSVFLAFVLASAMGPSGAFATEVTTSKPEISDAEFLAIQSEADEFMSLVEAELSANGSSVVDELNKQAAQYTDLLSACAEEDEEKLVSLIDTTNDLIDSYTTYKSGIVSLGIVDGIYSVEIAGAVAVFNSLGYDLAAELLTHAADNNTLDSYYEPTHGSDVTSSSVYYEILNGSSTSGSAVFTKTGGTNDYDLHYAINRFNYRKSDSGSVVVIEDRYDYEQGGMGGGITGMVVDQMAKAQDAGVLVPYYTYIVSDTNKTTRNQYETVSLRNTASEGRMFAKQVVLGKGEYKDFTITFSTPGYKLFQTFGPRDTKIEIFNSQGTSLTNGSGDDNGYSLNSMVKYYCVAGTPYTVRVKLYSTAQSGDMMFAVTPATSYIKSGSSTLNSYEDIFTFNVNSKFTLTSKTILNQTGVVTFTVTNTGKYDLQILSSLDTYFYVIDPRSSRDWKNGVDYNDDDGEGSNPKISNRELASGVPYLIVYSGYNVTNQAYVGDVQIIIEKIS